MSPDLISGLLIVNFDGYGIFKEDRLFNIGRNRMPESAAFWRPVDGLIMFFPSHTVVRSGPFAVLLLRQILLVLGAACDQRIAIDRRKQDSK